MQFVKGKPPETSTQPDATDMCYISVQPDATDICVTLGTCVGSPVVRQLVYNRSCTEYYYDIFSNRKLFFCSRSL
jgi:hypothetical protein